MTPLTERQAQILQVIIDFVKERGYPPTYRELGMLVGIRSTNGIHDHLMAIQRKGYISAPSSRTRGIIILSRPTGERYPGFREIAPALFRAKLDTDVLCDIKEAFDNV